MSTIVTEHLRCFAAARPQRRIARREDLLLAPPIEGPGARLRQHPPLEVVRFPAAFVASAFGPPQGLYESAHLRLEWQTMADHRQPFYHRNTGTDEISYQVCGDRTLMTEAGTVDLAPGDFVRLPEGLAHDNRGRADIHLLFYLPAPVRELAGAVRTTEARLPPFAGWEPRVMNELITTGLGGPGTDVAMMPVDERLLLEQALAGDERLPVLRAPDTGDAGTAWLYGSDTILLGRTAAPQSAGMDWHRNADADEIQMQMEGTRLLASQRGMVELQPGDFVRIPRGVAHASLHAAPSAHLTLLSLHALPQVAKTDRTAQPVDLQAIARLRRDITA